MAALQFNPAQADLIATQLSIEVSDKLEQLPASDDPASLLKIVDTIEPTIALMRELTEGRQTTQIQRVKKLALDHMRERETSVGYEHVNLLRVEAGEPEFIEGHDSQEAAERQHREAMRHDAEEALVARQVFEMARDHKGEASTRV